MESLTKNSKKAVCYRCRKASSSKSNSLLSCDLCTLFWHVDCISPSPDYVPTDKWMCPRHQKPSKRHSPSRKRMSKIKAREATTETLEEADEILKYGGVLHSKLAETIESEFLDYAKRYRQFNCSERNAKRQKSQWLDRLTYFQFNETDGIQMLIDAANTQLEEPTSSDQFINLDETQLKKFEAIQELVNLKGEGALLDILSET